MDKEFVPYQQSLALKELGFDEPCFGYYYNRELSFGARTSYGEVVEAPTFSQAFRWLRDKKLSDMCICRYQSRDDGDIYYYYHITHDFGIEETKHFKEGFISYEESELACLIKLIEIVKNKTMTLKLKAALYTFLFVSLFVGFFDINIMWLR